MPAARFLLRLSAGALVAALACSGGGDGPSGPSDQTPPTAPQLSRIRVEVPLDGLVTVRGDGGAVEPQATVHVENPAAANRGDSPSSAETRASLDGAFVLQVAAELSDDLSISASDDAGNRSTSVVLPAGPNPSTWRVTVLSGDGQTGVTGRPLTEPFRVRVRGGTPAADLTGVDVSFEVVSGGGSLSGTTARSELGIAEALLTLPAAAGDVQVRASLPGLPQEVLFEAAATGAPELDAVTPDEADRGTDVTLSGSNFSPIAAHNEVEFNGVPGEVHTATAERLTVRVPAFGSDGPLTVTLTGVRSNALPFKFRGAPPALPAVGAVQTTQLAGGSGELRLGFLTGSEEYVVAVQALSSASLSFRQGVSGDVVAAPAAAGAPAVTGSGLGGQDRFDAQLRGQEARMALDARAKGRAPAGVTLGGAEPQVGDRSVFHVINTNSAGASISDPRNFDEVQAVLRFKGAHTLVYVDERVAALDLTDADVRVVGERFENQTYGVDRAAFGNESDIDGDGRVTILLTPTVNALNQGANPDEGIIIGFFFGLDLLPELFPQTSNAREIFYGFVPDPDGRFGPAVAREFVLPTLHELYAHEFQHMISFNQHVLERSGQSEDLWLNEGLSSVAEDLNGFDDGNVARTAFFLQNPGASGLAVTNGPDGLGQRGAAFVFLRWLGDQLGDGVYRSLVQTNATGRANVEVVTGRAFGDLFSEWFPALFLDGAGLGGEARFQIPSLELRPSYEHFRQLNPDLGFGSYLALQTMSVPGGAVTADATGTAGSFTLVRTAAGTSERLVRVSSPPASQAQVSVIRVK